jgi:hypothetical protein
MNRLRDAAALVIARTANAWAQPADEAAVRDIATVQIDTSPSPRDFSTAGPREWPPEWSAAGPLHD